MKKLTIILTITLTLLTLTACGIIGDIVDGGDGRSFTEARADFTTTLTQQNNNQNPIPTPPEGVFELVHYPSEVGYLAAFISPDPGDGQLHPLMIWIVGGWSYGISGLPWSYPEWDNDQTGSAFREAGILMMYPSFRGANGNPGHFETLYGDIDDILAALEFAAALPYVDPDRIYLGGHSTGGTRVLLASALTDGFRAAFSFGPVADIGNHNRAQFTFDLNDREERRMRSPIHWMGDIASPTFIFEGADGGASTAADVRRLGEVSENANVHTFIIEGGDHFDILAPVTGLVAQKILQDTGASVNIALTNAEIQSAMNQPPPLSPQPIMLEYRNVDLGISFLRPVTWQGHPSGDEARFIYMADFYDYNFWTASSMLTEMYLADGLLTSGQLEEIIGLDPSEHILREGQISNHPAYIWEAILDYGDLFFSKVVVVQYDERLLILEFFVSELYMEPSMIMFERVVDSLRIE